MSVDLVGKKILLFAPKFFNYEEDIKRELEKKGAIVHMYDERNNPSSVEKILLRKFRVLMTRKINRFYKNVVKCEKSFSPDFVFFISPETINKKSILYLKQVFSNASFIMYMWDSIKNKKNTKYIYKYFDKQFSFDNDDCKKYGFNFRPLFFINEFEKNCEVFNYKYDFTFIGSVHSDRAKILNSLYKEFKEKNISFYFYLYVPGKLMYFLRSLIDKDFRELKNKYVHVTSLNKNEVSKIAEESNYIIDINHPKQIGLTMRTIEMLGLKKKLLTTNTHLREYDFYNPSNQIIIERRNVLVDSTLLCEEFQIVDEKVYNKYRLSEWINDILK